MVDLSVAEQAGLLVGKEWWIRGILGVASETHATRGPLNFSGSTKPKVQ